MNFRRSNAYDTIRKEKMKERKKKEKSEKALKKKDETLLELILVSLGSEAI